jgi:hypothetical protein
MAFQPSLSNGARLLLIAISGVLFAVQKGRAQQKKHRPLPEKASGLSFDTAMHPHSCKNFLGHSS